MWQCRRGWTSGNILSGAKRIERFGDRVILRLKTSKEGCSFGMGIPLVADRAGICKTVLGSST